MTNVGLFLGFIDLTRAQFLEANIVDRVPKIKFRPQTMLGDCILFSFLVSFILPTPSFLHFTDWYKILSTNSDTISPHCHENLFGMSEKLTVEQFRRPKMFPFHVHSNCFSQIVWHEMSTAHIYSNFSSLNPLPLSFSQNSQIHAAFFLFHFSLNISFSFTLSPGLPFFLFSFFSLLFRSSFLLSLRLPPFYIPFISPFPAFCRLVQIFADWIRERGVCHTPSGDDPVDSVLGAFTEVLWLY